MKNPFKNAVEKVARGLDAAGRTVAGDRGGRVAAKVSEALGCGHVEYTTVPCTGPDCPTCAELNS